MKRTRLPFFSGKEAFSLFWHTIEARRIIYSKDDCLVAGAWNLLVQSCMRNDLRPWFDSKRGLDTTLPPNSMQHWQLTILFFVLLCTTVRNDSFRCRQQRGQTILSISMTFVGFVRTERKHTKKYNNSVGGFQSHEYHSRHGIKSRCKNDPTTPPKRPFFSLFFFVV